MSDNTTKVAEDEIDLLALAKTIWKKRKAIAWIIIIFLFIGLLIAFLAPKEYKAETIFIPQTSETDRAGASLGGLASLAGINLSGMGGNSDILPSLYPKIVSSVTFQKALLEAEINVENLDKPVTYRTYFEEIHSPTFFDIVRQYTLGLPNIILKSLRVNSSTTNNDHEGLLKVSETEIEHFKRLEKQLSIVPNEKEGFVTLSFSLPEPLMAAQMAQFSKDLLQKAIIGYKISKAKEQLKFTEERYNEKKIEFEQIQIRLASFRDRNQNIASASVQNQLQKLEAEYNFSFNVYTELAKQLEQSKLQVSKDMPIFSVIEPVTVPVHKSSPNRVLILVIFIIIGFIVGLAYILSGEFLKNFKEHWNKI